MKSIFLYIFLFLFFTYSSSANSFRILTNEEPPTNYLDENKIITGITVDIVKKLQEELNLENKIELMTWARAYNIAQNNANIALFTAGKTSHRIQEGFYFIGPVITKKHILYSKSNKNISINSSLDIKSKDLKIAAMRGDWRAKYFKDKGFEVYETANHEQNIKKLMLERVDLWTSSNIEAAFIAKKAGIKVSSLKASYEFKEIPSYIMLSKDTSKEDVRRWQKAFLDLQKTDFFEKIAIKWSLILDIDLQYSKYKGFYKN